MAGRRLCHRKGHPAAGSPRLDFAHFSLGDLREDLEGTKWLNGGHWTFPSLPGAVKVRYPAVRTWQEQDRHFFTVTVRVIREDPAGHADTEVKMGTEGQEPYCRELTAGAAVPGEPSADPQAQDVNNLARTWTAEMCDSVHLDGHETVLRSLGTAGPA